MSVFTLPLKLFPINGGTVRLGVLLTKLNIIARIALANILRKDKEFFPYRL
jgi:hypothetical protein